MDLKWKIRSLVQMAVEAYINEQNQKKESITILLSYQSVNPDEVYNGIFPLLNSYEVTLLITKDWIPFFQNQSYRLIEELPRQELIQIIENTFLLVIPASSYSLLSKLALTMDNEPAVWIAIQYQLSGKPIIICNHGIELTVHQQILAPFSVQERLKTYVRQLQTDQVKWVPLSNLYQSVEDQLTKYKEKKPVILTKHIETAHKDGLKEFAAPLNSLLTPAAKDLAKELKIHISTSKGGS